MAVYKPEGRMPAHAEDAAQWTELDLQRAMIQGTILEGRAVLCDKDHNLLGQVGGFTGFMPRKKEAAMGIREGTAREIAIISRVNKPVAFRIIDIARDGQDVVPILSRAQVQEECLSYCLSHLSPGDVTEARVTHLEPFGAFVDIGCGVTSLITIDNISISRIAHPADRFAVGQGFWPLSRRSTLICAAFRSRTRSCWGPGRKTQPCLRRGRPFRALSAAWRATALLLSSPQPRGTGGAFRHADAGGTLRRFT